MTSADTFYFQSELDALEEVIPARITGRISRVVGLIAESQGLPAPVGARCEIICRRGEVVEAEVVGFRDDITMVVPYGDIRGIGAGDKVRYVGDVPKVRVGADLLGEILDSTGEPLGEFNLPGKKLKKSLPIASQARMPLHGKTINPMLRQRIEKPLATGIRVVDGLFTVGKGQRMGIFAGSGVGKSVLLSMIAKNTSADVTVIALIGERGREVREFVERDLGPDGLQGSVVVVATSDEPALKRVQGALTATAIAEFYRDQGLDVMLLIDSVTRVAMAQREIGLSAGEPPATKGYPPSVFALLPKLLERSGPGEVGSITAFYTVLVEGDDIHDPIGDSVRGILDGHLWLSRELAGQGHFPAVDPQQSISRSIDDIVSPEHKASQQAAIEMIARYREAEDLIQLGAYQPGRDVQLDCAVRAMPALDKFLKQGKSEISQFEDTLFLLEAAVKSGGGNPHQRLQGGLPQNVATPASAPPMGGRQG